MNMSQFLELCILPITILGNKPLLSQYSIANLLESEMSFQGHLKLLENEDASLKINQTPCNF